MNQLSIKARVRCMAVALVVCSTAANADDPPALGGLSFDVDVGPSQSVIGDVDGDGDLDLVLHHTFFVSQITLLRSQGDGSFESGELLAYFGALSAFTSPARLELFDLDDDGDLDLLALPTAVFLNDGEGDFGEPLPIAWQPHLDQPVSVRTGDLNGDDQLDFVLFGLSQVGGETVCSPHVFVGAGDGSFTAAPAQPELAGSCVAQFELFDMDGDETLDIVGANLADGAITSMRGLGDGIFLPQVPVAILPPSSGVPVTFADLNGDDWVDVIFGSELEPQLWVGLGGPTGDFTLQQSVPLPMPVDTSPTALVTGDFDGDGLLDVASSTLGVGGIWLHVGDGAGGLTLVGEMRPGTWTFGLQVADFGADGRDDIVGCSYAGDEVLVLRGSANSFVDIDFGGSELVLSGSGSTAPEAQANLVVQGASGQPVAYLASIDTALLPLADGLLVPALSGVLVLAPDDAPLAFRWPVGIPEATQVLVQAASSGKLSNAVAIVAR
jgi:hypothetical protein